MIFAFYSELKGRDLCLKIWHPRVGAIQIFKSRRDYENIKLLNSVMTIIY